MPELPEAETIKRELERFVLGKTIKDVIINRAEVIKEPSKNKFVRELKNSKIRKVLRKGKALIFELSSQKFLVVHLRMTGQLVYPGDMKKSRVSFRFSDGKILDFNDSRLLGELRLVDDWQDLKFFKKLGPEPFNLNADKFRKMLSIRKTKIKPLLLDQSFISGVGNIYAAEALFRAGISPLRSAVSLSDKEAKILFNKIKGVLTKAIECGGSSVDQYVRVSGSNGTYGEHHKVYDRKDEPCVKCKKPIARIALGGRGTYFCPHCQK